MQNYSSELKTFAFRVSDLLGEYVELHNKLGEDSRPSFRGLFRPINFNDYSEKTKGILKSLEEILQIVETSHTDIDEQNLIKFRDCLIRYLEALISTNELFQEKINYLLEISKGGGGSLSTHMKNTKEYEKAISGYTKIGDELNRLFKQL